MARKKINGKTYKQCLNVQNTEVQTQSGPKGGQKHMMRLENTIELMLSADWKDRFVAEYLQTKIRYEKLHAMIVKRTVGRMGFETPIPLDSWLDQAKYMAMYLYELEKQAAIHGIELPIVG